MIYVSFCPIISGERTISSYIQDYRKSRSFATYNEVRYIVCWAVICVCLVHVEKLLNDHIFGRVYYHLSVCCISLLVVYNSL
jgi:hypothetical protein